MLQKIYILKVFSNQSEDKLKPPSESSQCVNQIKVHLKWTTVEPKWKLIQNITLKIKLT